MPDYPPYVNAYNSIPKLFAAIKSAAVPAKVTQDFLQTVLELRSSSHRALIPLLKKLGFIDEANAPTQAYREFREDARSGEVMSQQLRHAYAPLFAANEYAYKLNRADLLSKLRSVTGAAEDDPNIAAVASTFLELSKLASWNAAPTTRRASTPPAEETKKEHPVSGDGSDVLKNFGLSYTINLNLPATTEIEVFNAIFKSLRENLLRES
jgi:hypothetical protein